MRNRSFPSSAIFLVALGALCANDCLVESTPDYREPPPLPPRLLLHLADPSILQIVEVALGDTKPFTVPIHPEDVGHHYQTMVYLDYGVEGEQWLDLADTDSGEDTIRFTFTVDDSISEGCHQLTLLTARAENMDLDNKIPFDFRNATVTTWWLDRLPAVETSSALIKDCPSIKMPTDGEP